jgi:IclR family transcriptional regulator, acetate operon repressor
VKPPAGTQAIVRAVRLLKVIAGRGEAASLNDLATELQLSKPTIHRILGALESEGLVAKGERGFRLGAGVVTLGAQALAGSNLRAIARGHLERLAADSGETATLEIPSGDSMLILDEVRGGQVIGAHIEVGTRWPMYATSTGKAVLGALPTGEMAARLRPSRTALTRATLVSVRDLRAACRESAERGFAVTRQELEEGYSAVAAVVRGPGGQVIAALSLGGPSDRMEEDRLMELGKRVRQAAKELSASLGA